MNALFTPLDMTDYEDTFVGFDEIAGRLPINSPGLLKPVVEEPWPTNIEPFDAEEDDPKPKIARSKSHRELLESKNTEDEEEEEEEEEEGEEEEGEAEEVEEEAPYEVPVPPKNKPLPYE
jgi:hypothetical protein